MRIMMVDNDAAWIRSQEILLKGHGHQVYAFTNPLEACDFIQQIYGTGFLGSDELPDAIVLDYVMPEMSGFQVLSRISDMLTKECRIVFVTGHSEQLETSRLTETDRISCLSKPVDFDLLENVLEGKAA